MLPRHDPEFPKTLYSASHPTLRMASYHTARCIFLTVAILTASLAQAAEIKGKVVSISGEALGRVEVSIVDVKLATVTSPTGTFAFANLPPGSFTLRLNAVGYRLQTVPFTIGDTSDVKEFSITLAPDNFHQTDKVEVRGDVFQLADSPATNETNLTSTEIRETSTVFADDPFRSIQSLPGVSPEGGNEFYSEFSVMGAPFSSVSIYIDDVLVPSPFHEISNFSDGASLGVLTSEVVQDMKLMPAAYPERFGDSAGTALDIHTRDGSRGTPMFRISSGIAATEVLGEGGLGHAEKGSLLVSVRRSYINYLIKDRVTDSADVDFYDGDLKLNYDLTARQSVSFYATGGHTDLHDSTATDVNSFASGNSDFALGRVGWRWGITPHLLLEARGALIREPSELRNPFNVIAETNDYNEKVGSATVSWNWAREHVLEAGWSTRHVRENISSNFVDPDTGEPSSTQFGGSALHSSGYLQQGSSLWKSRVHMLGGVRWDRVQGIGLYPFSPQISVALRATSSTEVQLAAGRYQQFPALEQWSGQCYVFGTMPEKSDHYTAGVEQRLTENTRIRLQVFDRQDAFSVGQVPGQFISNPSGGDCPHEMQPVANSTYLRDYSRGAQIILQRRSANRLSGWLGYTLAKAQQRQYGVSVPGSFVNSINTSYSPTLEDQRNSVSMFAMYRLKPSINLSGKFLYGSGFPVSNGNFVSVGTSYEQTGTQNLRYPYLRLDLRADKDWAFRHWKMTLYGEVLNLTNHYNTRYVFSTVIDPATGQSQVKTLQGLPITPTVGLAFQF